MKKVNSNTHIGVDGLEIQVNTKQTKNNIESKDLYSKKTGVKIGRVKAINKTGFRLYINLPKMVRTDNVRPFGVIDKIHLEELLSEITDILFEFCVDVHNAFISTVEINATAQLNSNKSTECNYPDQSAWRRGIHCDQYAYPLQRDSGRSGRFDGRIPWCEQHRNLEQPWL